MAGIVAAPDGSFSVVEPMWGDDGGWRILEPASVATVGRDTLSADDALVLYRPLNGIEVPLDRGDSGAAVFTLQTALTRMGVLKKKDVDGVYGSVTSGAVAFLQKQWQLESSGHVDDPTAYYLTRFMELRN
jgi:peptidoglycan hydrolase-like protein with peptidoglycan-binding domain